MNNSNLRGMILFALAIDSTPAEVKNMQGLISDTFDNINSIEPDAIAAQLPIVAAVAAPGGLAPPPTIVPTATTSAVTLDRDGLPWDERIHSSTKGLNADGTWRARRGVEAGIVTKVKAELLATVNAPVVIQTEAPAAVIPAAPGLPLPPTLPAPPAPPTLPLPPAAPENARYAEFVQFIASNTRSDTNTTGRLTAEWTRETLKYLGVANGDMQNLAHNPALLETCFAHITTALQG